MKEDRTMKGMVDYMDYIGSRKYKPNHHEKTLVLIFRYKKFLQQSLALWQFIPCGEDGKPLEDQSKKIRLPSMNMAKEYNRIDAEYQAAKDRCYFEGFFWDEEDNCVASGVYGYPTLIIENNEILLDNGDWNETLETIQCLVAHKLTLTQSKYKELFNPLNK